LLLNYKTVFKPERFKNLLIYLGGAGVIGILPIVYSIGCRHAAASIVTGIFTGTTSLGTNTTLNTALDWKQEIFKYVETNQPIRLALLCAAINGSSCNNFVLFQKKCRILQQDKTIYNGGSIECFCITLNTEPEISDSPSLIEATRSSTMFGNYYRDTLCNDHIFD